MMCLHSIQHLKAMGYYWAVILWQRKLQAETIQWRPSCNPSTPFPVGAKVILNSPPYFLFQPDLGYSMPKQRHNLSVNQVRTVSWDSAHLQCGSFPMKLREVWWKCWIWIPLETRCWWSELGINWTVDKWTCVNGGAWLRFPSLLQGKGTASS